MADDRYQALFTQSTVGMGYFDQAGRILEINPAFCRLLGYSETELVGNYLHHFVHPADLHAYQQAFGQLLDQVVYSLQLEQTFLHRSGKSLWVLARFSILDRDLTQGSGYISGTFDDIDHRKRLELSLRRSAQRDALLANFTQAMLRSLDLQDILQSSVDAIQQHLNSDRVIVYRFESDSERHISQPKFSVGRVIVESVQTDWPVMVGRRITDQCFRNERCLRPYRDGKVSAIRNIHQAGYPSCYLQMLTQFGVVSNLIVPILGDEDLWGLLVIQQCSRERDWQLDEINLLKQITGQMAIAIKQGELYTQTQQEALRQRALNELSSAILSAQSLETFFQLALHKVRHIFHADHVIIGQYRPANQDWLLIAEVRKHEAVPSFLGEELTLRPEQLWPSPTSFTPCLTTHLKLQYESPSLPPSKLFDSAWVIAPLLVQAGVWGSLMIATDAAEVDTWVPAKIDLVELVSRQLSLAIRQNLLYKQWQRQAEQAERLNRLDQAIRETLDLAKIFRLAAPEIRELLQVERVLIWEFDPNHRLWMLRVDKQSGNNFRDFTGLEVPDDDQSFTYQLKQGKTFCRDEFEGSLVEVNQVLSKTFPGAWLLVPLRVNQMTWGIIHCIQKDEWQEWQKTVAQAIADKLAIAVQQSLLYGQVEAANYKLQELALIDGLTQIPNRRYFDSYLQQEWRRTQRESSSLSLILCDVDFFKPYNDTYGHQQGDKALRQIAATIQTTVKRPGDIVARYGGEEFGIILPATSAVGAARIAESVQAAIAKLSIPHAYSKVSSYITLSMGIASTRAQAPLTPTELVDCADQALYIAKRQGRDRFHINQSITSDSSSL